ncbi:MAG: Gfo/Idh/MocA family oxidoreductase [Armatimonadetes bacterium]|nr:Gfo/Idh/MocA family oxidoreductase [Armatimonadota bacterium]
MEKGQFKDDMTRRQLLARAGATAVAGAASPILRAMERTVGKSRILGANDRVVFGLIGCGGMGSANMRNFMTLDGVDVAAICDVDTSRMPGDIETVDKKYGHKPEVFHDYRKMLERKDIDAIIVGTPDHWHALNLIHAVEAGKDCYCEKPISHDIVEAKSMAAAAKHYKRVVQVGTWQRSTKEFTDAIAYIRAGKLGKVVLCRAWISDTSHVGTVAPSQPPAGLDYDAWVGPAKMVPYAPNHVHNNWRWFMNFGGGDSVDWGVHMMDIALLGMSKDQDLVMPVSASAVGGKYAFVGEDRDAPDTVQAIYQFKDPDFVMHWAIGRDFPGRPDHGTEFVSAEGKTLRVWRGGWVVLDKDGKELPKEGVEETTGHWTNFLECVKSRGKPRADIASVAQTTMVCHMANIAVMTGEQLHWDKSKMDLVGRTGKNAIGYQREYRKGYTLPIYK